MDIVGLKTKIELDPSVLIDGEVFAGENIKFSTNSIILNTEVGSSGATSITLHTINGDAFPDYSYSIIKSGKAPIAISSIATATDIESITVTYTPTEAQRSYCVIRFTFGTFSFDVYVHLIATLAIVTFNISPSNIDFGDIGDNTSAVKTCTIACSDASFTDKLLSFGITSTVLQDNLNFFVEVQKHIGNSIDGYSYYIIYHPLYSVSSSATLNVFYNQVIVGSVALNGAKANLIPTVLSFGDVSTKSSAPNGQTDLYVSYQNTGISSTRITSAELINDPLNEFSINNLSSVIDTTVAPSEIIRISLSYTPLQSVYTPPQLNVNGTATVPEVVQTVITPPVAPIIPTYTVTPSTTSPIEGCGVTIVFSDYGRANKVVGGLGTYPLDASGTTTIFIDLTSSGVWSRGLNSIDFVFYNYGTPTELFNNGYRLNDLQTRNIQFNILEQTTPTIIFTKDRHTPPTMANMVISGFGITDSNAKLVSEANPNGYVMLSSNVVRIAMFLSIFEIPTEVTFTNTGAKLAINSSNVIEYTSTLEN